jgi:DNA repair exonuclease SbcCD ATPase subunit
VKFKKLTIDNFMAIGHAEIELSDRGLVLIEGVNNFESSADSNGAGKSTIADALSWVNYGETARGEDGDNVVNDSVGKNCRVEEIIEDGDDVYKVIRHRKHAKGKNGLQVLKLEKNGTITDLTKGTDKLTQVELTKILGCSIEVFNGAVYAGQEKMPDLPGMTDKSLKMLIEEASGATLLETAYVEANKRFQAAKNDANTASANLSSAATRLADAKQRVTDAETNRNEYEAQRAIKINGLAGTGRALKKEIEDYTVTIQGLGDAVAIRQEIADVEMEISGINGEIAEERRLTGIATVKQSEHQRVAMELRSMEQRSKSEQARFAALDHQVGCPCTTCDRPFSAEDIAPAKTLAATEITKIAVEITEIRARLDTAFKAHQDAVDAREAFAATMTDISAASAKRASLQSQLDAIRTAEADLANKKTRFASIIQQIKDARDAENPFVKEIAKQEVVVKASEATLAGCESTAKDAALAQAIAESVAKVFSPTGVRAFLLDEVTPFLNDQTAKYLGTLSDGHVSATWTTLIKNAKGELREKFSIEVENANGGKTFKSISGGEKRKVRVACALALQDLVARRATKPIELFIGDEIDDALDRAGQERLMNILEEKARERGSVFIISHADLKDWIRTTITVKRDGPCSTIEEKVS